MDLKTLARAVLIAPSTGGEITVTDMGETIKIGYLPGIHRNLSDLGQYFSADADYNVNKGVIGLRTKERGIVLRGPQQHETGANPDFQPVRLTDGEAKLYGIVKAMQSRVAGLTKREKAVKEKIEPQLVEEPTPEPAPAPEAKKAEPETPVAAE